MKIQLFTRSLLPLIVLFSSTIIAQTVEFTSATMVKRADRSGICHPPATIYYDRVTRFELMSLEDCLTHRVGTGRLPVQYQAYWAARQQYEEYLRNQPQHNGQTPTDCNDLPNGSDPMECLTLEAQNDIASEETGNTVAQFNEFAGYRFGLGLAAMVFDSPQISNVEIVDGTVYVRETRDVSTSVLFEAHKFITSKKYPGIGTGPFIAASLADDADVHPLSVFGVGWMIGWKHRDSTRSWNVGVGWFVDVNGLEFRDELSDGASTDVTNAKDLTRTTDQSGLMVMFSSNW